MAIVAKEVRLRDITVYALVDKKPTTPRPGWLVSRDGEFEAASGQDIGKCKRLGKGWFLKRVRDAFGL
jgi:hypothetical protein